MGAEDDTVQQIVSSQKLLETTEEDSPASQRVCAILSIMANSINPQCNAFQAVQGFFLESANMPECVVKVLAHGGWCVSLSSTANIIKSLTKE